MQKPNSALEHPLLRHITLIGSGLLAIVIVRRGKPALLVLPLILVLLDLIGKFYLSKRLKQLALEKQEFVKAVQSMSLADARMRALEELAGNASIVTHPAEGDRPATDSLCPSLEDIFSKYKLVEFPDGSTLELGPRSGEYIRVGSGLDGAHLVLRIADQALAEVESLPPDETDEENFYPSVFHWIMFGGAR